LVFSKEVPLELKIEAKKLRRFLQSKKLVVVWLLVEA
jgi:hypothetical protein